MPQQSSFIMRSTTKEWFSTEDSIYHVVMVQLKWDIKLTTHVHITFQKQQQQQQCGIPNAEGKEAIV